MIFKRALLAGLSMAAIATPALAFRTEAAEDKFGVYQLKDPDADIEAYADQLADRQQRTPTSRPETTQSLTPFGFNNFGTVQTMPRRYDSSQWRGTAADPMRFSSSTVWTR